MQPLFAFQLWKWHGCRVLQEGAQNPECCSASPSLSREPVQILSFGFSLCLAEFQLHNCPMLPMQSKPSPAVLGVNQTQKFKEHNHVPSQSCSLAFFMPLFLPSDLIQTLLGFILAALELAILLRKDPCRRRSAWRAVSRVTCAGLIAGRKLKCSMMMIPYRHQMVAISWMCQGKAPRQAEQTSLLDLCHHRRWVCVSIARFVSLSLLGLCHHH